MSDARCPFCSAHLGGPEPHWHFRSCRIKTKARALELFEKLTASCDQTATRYLIVPSDDHGALIAEADGLAAAQLAATTQVDEGHASVDILLGAERVGTAKRDARGHTKLYRRGRGAT